MKASNERRVTFSENGQSPRGSSGAIFLSVKPADTLDNQSAHSNDNVEDYLTHNLNFPLSLLYAILATIMCFPIGCLAMRNVKKIRTHLNEGRKGRAQKHSDFAKNLSLAACVIGTIFCVIVSLVLVILFVILKKTDVSF